MNARTEPPEDIDKPESPAHLPAAADKVAITSIDNHTFESVEMMKELRDARLQAQPFVADCQKILRDQCPGAAPIPQLAGAIELSIVKINFESLEDPVRRTYFIPLPTSFSLWRKQVDDLIAVGGELLEMVPEFQRFVRGLEKPWAAASFLRGSDAVP